MAGLLFCQGILQQLIQHRHFRIHLFQPPVFFSHGFHLAHERGIHAAVCTALRKPNMLFVRTKNELQQDIQALHRARQRLVKHRTALVAQVRGLLLDRGIAIPLAITRFRRLVPGILEDLKNPLSPMARETIGDLFYFLLSIDARVTIFDRKIAAVFRQSKNCQRIAKVCGVGPKTATAIVAAIGDGAEFKNGRHLEAWLGLVPRQHSSGDRQRLMCISKRGDRHLRTLLVHGARAVVRVSAYKNDPFSQ